jgi:hypothetical protein
MSMSNIDDLLCSPIGENNKSSMVICFLAPDQASKYRMKIAEIINEEADPRIYHWTTASKAITALKTNRLQARRWQHYLEQEQRMTRGTSWATNPVQWARGNPVCFVADSLRIPNRIYSINGNRTFLLTKGMIDPLYDPNAYKFEPTEPDEEFVEGAIQSLSSVLIEIRVRGLSSDVFTQIQQLSTELRIPLRPST